MNRVLQLSAEIYSDASIDKACRAYEGYAKIKVKKFEKYTELRFDRCKYDAELTIREFENYLINVENS